MSASRELSPDWVLSSFIQSSGNSRDEMMELADAARLALSGRGFPSGCSERDPHEEKTKASQEESSRNKADSSERTAQGLE